MQCEKNCITWWYQLSLLLLTGVKEYRSDLLSSSGDDNCIWFPAYTGPLLAQSAVFLFLSNAMHGQNINYLCVCVCVSVTLSVNSPTGQTPQRIFTVDSLKDKDLCKDVHFAGLDDE